MRMTMAGLVAGLVLMYSAASLADCARPRPAFEIPEGASATEQDLSAAQGRLVAFAEQVREYLRCLNGEVSQKSVGKDEAARAELAQTHVATHQEAANELTGLADCYNAQLQSFKSPGGGKKKRAADCASFITAAASRERANAPVTSQLTVEASGHSFDVPSGTWIYYLVRDDSPRVCSGNAQCLYRAVHVRNDSDEVLECTGDITYEGTDVAGNESTRSRALVPGRTTYVVVESLARQEINASLFEAQCKPRPRLADLDTPADCKYQVVEPVAIGDYYPDEARQASQEGPVIVEFTLPGKAAHPTGVRVAAGSLFESLDQAAVKAVSDMVMSSSCPNARYRLKLNFQLE